jgi:hypothetical protein
MQLEAQELLDISHAMEASLAPDDADDSPGEPSPPPLSSGSSSEEEQKEHAPVWSEHTASVRTPAFEAASGKQHEARHTQSPLDFLQLFLPVELMQQIAVQTTAYAHTRGASEEWQTSASELYAFLGVHIFMGICRLPQWHMYWSTEFQQPFVAATFRRDRFEQLLRYFHVAPPHDAAAAHDPFERVRPLIRSLQRSFERMYAPTQPLTVDECMVGFKGRPRPSSTSSRSLLAGATKCGAWPTMAICSPSRCTRAERKFAAQKDRRIVSSLRSPARTMECRTSSTWTTTSLLPPSSTHCNDGECAAAAPCSAGVAKCRKLQLLQSMHFSAASTSPGREAICLSWCGVIVGQCGC